jgi:hypothetical protein
LGREGRGKWLEELLAVPSKRGGGLLAALLGREGRGKWLELLLAVMGENGRGWRGSS